MKLRAYLKEHQESERAFAERSGVSLSTVKRINQTGYAKSTAAIEKIARSTANAVTAVDLVRSASIKKPKKSAA